MPRPVQPIEVPVTLPDLHPEPWDGFDGSDGHPVPFWRQPVTDAPIDAERTAQLAAWDVTVEHAAGNPPSSQRPTWGIPYQIVDSARRTRVWNLARPIRWWPFPVQFPWENLPLPAVVRREGDPHPDWNTGHDRKWRGWDPTARRLFEAISVAPHPLFGWSCAGVAEWDTTRPWDAPGQPSGVCAAKVPYLPMVPRWDEVITGVVQHALFCSWPNYAPGPLPPARGSDGLWPGYPLHAGHRLRLRSDRVDALWADANRAERALLLGMHHYGLFAGDKWTTASPHLNSVRAHLSQDRRWHDGDDHSPPPRRQLVQLTDFDVITPPTEEP